MNEKPNKYQFRSNFSGSLLRQFTVLLGVLMLVQLGWSDGAMLHADESDLLDWPENLSVPERPDRPKEIDVSYRCGRDGNDCGIDDFMERNQVCGLYVMHGDQLILHRTRSAEAGIGCDRALRGHAHGIASITKSITSILFGIFFTDRRYGRYFDDDEAKLEGQSVSELLAPEVVYPDPEVTVGHVLQMRSGMDFTNERDGNRIRVQEKHRSICETDPASDPRCTIRGQVNLVLQDARFDNRRRYNYSNFDTQIIGLMLQKRLEEYFKKPDLSFPTELKAGTFPPDKLIGAFERFIARQAGFENRFRWKADFSDQSPSPCCLRIAGTDLAKFGAWVLSNYLKNDGVIGNWLRRSITNRVKVSDNYCRFGTFQVRMEYGYQWWIPNAEREVGDPGESGFTAIGRGGQYVHVFPEQNVVVVQQSAWDPEPLPLFERSRDNRACEAFLVRKLIADEVASR